MASSNGHHGYDEDLLASAPAPTKGMVQVRIFPESLLVIFVHPSVLCYSCSPDFSRDMLRTSW